jgi:hypothetical protein
MEKVDALWSRKKLSFYLSVILIRIRRIPMFLGLLDLHPDP